MGHLCFCSVLCLLCLCVRLFICTLWSPVGKGLTSWLSFVVSNCECHFPIGILGLVWYLIVSIPDLCTLAYFHTVRIVLYSGYSIVDCNILILFKHSTTGPEHPIYRTIDQNISLSNSYVLYLCTCRLQPPRNDCAVRVQWFSSVILPLTKMTKIGSALLNNMTFRN